MSQLARSLVMRTWGSTWAIALLLALFAFPASEAAAQDLGSLTAEEAAEDSDTAPTDRGAPQQKLEVKMVGILAYGGVASPAVGTLTVTIVNTQTFRAASGTYAISLSGNPHPDTRERFRRFVQALDGHRAYLKGHLHGASPHPTFHVTHWSTVPDTVPQEIEIDYLVGLLIDQRGMAFAGGEGTAFAVMATHNHSGTPIRFNLSLNGSPSPGNNCVEIRDAPVRTWFIIVPQFVITAAHYRVF